LIEEVNLTAEKLETGGEVKSGGVVGINGAGTTVEFPSHNSNCSKCRGVDPKLRSLIFQVELPF